MRNVVIKWFSRPFGPLSKENFAARSAADSSRREWHQAAGGIFLGYTWTFNELGLSMLRAKGEMDA